jgi:hypothetical protein
LTIAYFHGQLIGRLAYIAGADFELLGNLEGSGAWQFALYQRRFNLLLQFVFQIFLQLFKLY